VAGVEVDEGGVEELLGGVGVVDGVGVGAFAGGSRFGDRVDECFGAAGVASVVVEDDVAGDGEQPGSVFVAGVVSGVFVGAEEYVVGEVFG
jgi:hypothetical protein